MVATATTADAATPPPPTPAQLQQMRACISAEIGPVFAAAARAHPNDFRASTQAAVAKITADCITPLYGNNPGSPPPVSIA